MSPRIAMELAFSKTGRGLKARRFWVPNQKEYLSRRLVMSIEAILDRKGRDLVAIRPTATVQYAAVQMLKHKTEALIVTRGNVVAGIVSEREIVHAVARHDAPAPALPLLNIVAAGTVSITPKDSAKEAMRLMIEHRVRVLPVTDDGKLIGVVSFGDVITQRLVDLEMESNVLRDAYIAAR